MPTLQVDKQAQRVKRIAWAPGDLLLTLSMSDARLLCRSSPLSAQLDIEWNHFAIDQVIIGNEKCKVQNYKTEFCLLSVLKGR